MHDTFSQNSVTVKFLLSKSSGSFGFQHRSREKLSYKNDTFAVFMCGRFFLKMLHVWMPTDFCTELKVCVVKNIQTRVDVASVSTAKPL